MGAALGHTQSLHTNALDEAIALPTDFSARIARNTQIYIQEETNVCREVDPWAGSYYIETLTNEIAHKAWERIEEVEKTGRYGQGHRNRYSEDAYRGGGSPQAGPHRLGHREDHRRKRIPSGSRSTRSIFWLWTTRPYARARSSV